MGRRLVRIKRGRRYKWQAHRQRRVRHVPSGSNNNVRLEEWNGCPNTRRESTSQYGSLNVPSDHPVPPEHLGGMCLGSHHVSSHSPQGTGPLQVSLGPSRPFPTAHGSPKGRGKGAAGRQVVGGGHPPVCYVMARRAARWWARQVQQAGGNGRLVWHSTRKCQWGARSGSTPRQCVLCNAHRWATRQGWG